MELLALSPNLWRVRVSLHSFKVSQQNHSKTSVEPQTFIRTTLEPSDLTWNCVSEGAKKEGAAGFFKGIGKGLVGVVARPTGGIVDMASSTFQGIQRYRTNPAYFKP